MSLDTQPTDNSPDAQLAFGSTALNILDISDIIEFLAYFKSSSISQLINGKPRDRQKFPKSFNETTTSAFNLFALSELL